MPIVRVGETDLFYARHGSGGPALVLIHGAGGNHLLWPPTLRRLPSATVYALDLPGHGRSPGKGRDQIEDYAADLLGFLDAVDVDQAVLLGHSMGGAIAQTVALTTPQRVLGLVLVGTGAKLRVAPAILEGLLQDFEQTVAMASQWVWGPDTDPTLVAEGQRAMEAAGSQVLHGDFAACDQFDVRDQVAQITVPTLALTGSEDKMTPPRFGQWLADHIPGAQFQLIEGAGHMVMLEKPATTGAAVGAWLDSLD